MLRTSFFGRLQYCQFHIVKHKGVVPLYMTDSFSSQLSFQVKNHVLRYIFRLGDRMKILSIPQLNVTDDKYHTVIVKREGNRASLQIDYEGKVEGTTGGLHKLLNMGGGSFFTGGLPNVTEVRSTLT